MRAHFPHAGARHRAATTAVGLGGRGLGVGERQSPPPRLETTAALAALNPRNVRHHDGHPLCMEIRGSDTGLPDEVT